MSRSLLLPTLAVTGLFLASCGADNDTTENSSSEGYPISIDNCGREVTVDEPIERAVSLNQGITEILLAMGQEDRVVGSATWTDPVREDLADANDDIPRLAENNASLETVLAEDPDFVAASFYNTLSETGSGSPEQYEDLGVPVYLAYTECTKSSYANTDGARDEQLTWDSIYHDISDLGTLFDVQDDSTALIDELEQRVADASEASAAPDTTVAFWFADSEAPYMAGGVGAPQLIADSLELTNVFADSTEEWPQMSWEAIAAEDPDVLVIGDLTRDSVTAESAEAKIEYLKNHPVASQMTAVQEERFVLVAGADMNPSIRTVDGIEKVSEGLEEFNLTDG